MWLVGLYLSKYGPKDPPARLGAQHWKDAYDLFYLNLSEGRLYLHFQRSLKNTRDSYDSYFPNDRIGWKVKPGKDDDPKPLPELGQEIYDEWNDKSEDQLWDSIKGFIDRTFLEIYRNVQETLEVEEEQREDEDYQKRTEGGKRVVVSTRRERNPRLRTDAIRIHGYSCQACGFNFEMNYGTWGREWIEVHHSVPLEEGERETDPERDLTVLCSNCHRMIHRKRDKVLSVQELRNKLAKTHV